MIGNTDTPEQRFIASIILRAYDDMLSKDEGDARSAMSFLTTSYGDTARWRNHLCSLLGIDGDLLARRVRRQLDGEQPTRILTRQTTLEAGQPFLRNTKRRLPPPASVGST